MPLSTRPTDLPHVSLNAIAQELGVLYAGPHVYVRSIVSSTREAEPGSLFVAVPGARSHGAKFAEQAREAGAVAALTDHAGAELTRAAGLPTIVVDSPREVLGRASAFVYQSTAGAPTLIGVTGTNGKTTTTYLVRQLLASLGMPSALSGTVERRINNKSVETRLSGRLTTPEADYLHGLVSRMRQERVRAAAIEVSAQAVTQRRVSAFTFDAMIFTNLSQDHLDDYGTMEHYYETKAKLFTPEHTRRGIVSIDDDWGKRLAREATVPIVTVSRDRDLDPDYYVETREQGLERTEFTIHDRSGPLLSTWINHPGWFLAVDAALAMVSILTLGLERERLQALYTPVDGFVVDLPGRLDLVNPQGGGPRIYVDYGHTPESFRAVLGTLRRFTDGKLFMVFGADGDRDTTKRPDMARAAAIADTVVVTDYNPRFEDPAAIRQTLLDTLRTEFPDREVYEIPDAGEGIAKAVSLAAEDDIIFVGGHGHRLDVEVRGKVIPFSVKEAARAALREHGW